MVKKMTLPSKYEIEQLRDDMLADDPTWTYDQVNRLCNAALLGIERQWVPVAERLPENTARNVIILRMKYDKYPEVTVGRLSRRPSEDPHAMWIDSTEQVPDEGCPDEFSDVTHWQSLPAP